MSKDLILKIAKVKDIKSFYKKFPTEEAFMKKHAKAFKKAQMGAYISGEKTSNPQMMNFNDYYDQVDTQITGTNNPERQQQAYQQQMLAAQQGQKQGGGLGNIMGMVSQGMKLFGEEDGSGGQAQQMWNADGAIDVSARNGRDIPKAQVGYQTNQWNTPQQTQMQLTPIQTQMGGYQSMQGTQGQGMDLTMAGTGQPLAANVTQKGPGVMETIGKYAGPAAKLVEGFQALKAEKEALRGAEQWRDVSNISLQASRTRPEQTERRYTRPEDIQNTGEEFFPIYGVGTNVLAKDGAKLQGGGGVPWGPIGQVGSGIGNAITGNNAGGTIGGTLGGTVGSIFGPAGEAIGSTLGTLAGGFLDKNPKRTKKAQEATNRNMQGMAAGAMGQGIQQQYQGYMRTGGSLRQNNMDELQVYDGEAEQISTNPYLPDGGETVMFRGPSHDDGGMDISYGNSPVEVEGGEPAVKLQDGGQPGQENLVVYGNLPIPKGMIGDPDAKGKKFKNYANLLSKKEESQNKLVDKTSKNLDGFDPITTFDKIKLASYEANLLGANMKLKSLAEKKIEAASLQNAINDTAREQGIVAEDLAKGRYKVDKKAVKEQAQGGISLPYFENLLPEQQHPIYPGEFTSAEEDEPIVRNPKTKRVPGGSVTGINPGSINYKNIGMEEPSYWKTEEAYNNEWVPMVDKMFADPLKAKDFISRIENYSGDDFDDVRAALAKGKTYEEKIVIAQRLAKDKKIGPYHQLVKGSADVPVPEPELTPIDQGNKRTWNADGAIDTSVKKEPLEMVEPNKRSLLMDMYNQALPFLRPTDQEPLDPNQLVGEMYSMMSNQLEPVQAQSYQPQLDVPYDISLQDIRNENQADYRGAQRMVGYNPAAQASLAGQKFLANQKVGAEEFRMNQAMKDKVYSGNRATMNDAQLKNLAIYDQQYSRQSEAKSNTKANTLAALSSMSDKFQKNKLENRQLGIYENMYNYRYDAKGRAINMNGLQQLYPDGSNSTEGISDAEQLFSIEEKKDALKQKIKDKKAAEKKALGGKRNGGLVKAFRNF